MKYYTCPICQTQIMEEFDSKKQENVGMRICNHARHHTIDEVTEFLITSIVDNFTNTNVQKPKVEEVIE